LKQLIPTNVLDVDKFFNRHYVALILTSFLLLPVYIIITQLMIINL